MTYQANPRETHDMSPSLKGALASIIADPDCCAASKAIAREAVSNMRDGSPLETNGSVSNSLWLRDVDGSGSMHPCAKGDPGAVEYRPVHEGKAVAELVRRMQSYLDRNMLAGRPTGISLMESAIEALAHAPASIARADALLAHIAALLNQMENG